MTRSKYIPAPTQWEGYTLKDEINGYKILTIDSTCPCSIGGKISVQHQGHGEQHEVN